MPLHRILLCAHFRDVFLIIIRWLINGSFRFIFVIASCSAMRAEIACIIDLRPAMDTCFHSGRFLSFCARSSLCDLTVSSALFSEPDQVSVQLVLVFFAAGQENHLVAFGAFPDQFAGLPDAVFVHVGERIVQDDDASAVGEEMVRGGQTESKGDGVLGAFRQEVISDGALVGGDVQVQPVRVRLF